MARYARRSAQVGSLGALEAVRAELADPVSDQVLLELRPGGQRRHRHRLAHP